MSVVLVVKSIAASDHSSASPAQVEAGNFRMRKIKWHGMDISIEHPAGSIRTKTSPTTGKTWSRKMQSDYGYLRRTTGVDGDHVDVFCGPDMDSDSVFVVHQVKQDGGFDEHKVMIGFKTLTAATRGYLDNYEKGWKIGPVKKMSVDGFKEWMKQEGLSKAVEAGHEHPYAQAMIDRFGVTNNPRSVGFITNTGKMIPHHPDFEHAGMIKEALHPDSGAQSSLESQRVMSNALESSGMARLYADQEDDTTVAAHAPITEAQRRSILKIHPSRFPGYVSMERDGKTVYDGHKPICLISHLSRMIDDANQAYHYADPEKLQHVTKAIQPEHEWITAAKAHFGLTRDPREAGYILPNGEMLDFSGRHNAPPNPQLLRSLVGKRGRNHTEIWQVIPAGTNWRQFQFHTGAIRFSHTPDHTAIDIHQPMTQPQKAAVMRYGPQSSYFTADAITPREVPNDYGDESRYLGSHEIDPATPVGVRQALTAAEGHFTSPEIDKALVSSGIGTPGKTKWTGSASPQSSITVRRPDAPIPPRVSTPGSDNSPGASLQNPAMVKMGRSIRTVNSILRSGGANVTSSNSSYNAGNPVAVHDASIGGTHPSVFSERFKRYGYDTSPHEHEGIPGITIRNDAMTHFVSLRPGNPVQVGAPRNQFGPPAPIPPIQSSAREPDVPASPAPSVPIEPKLLPVTAKRNPSLEEELRSDAEMEPFYTSAMKQWEASGRKKKIKDIATGLGLHPENYRELVETLNSMGMK